MDFSREAWRKLYIRENLDHQSWPLFARGLRDYLIRSARDDGTLVAKTEDPCGDVARALRATDDEVSEVRAAVELMIYDGYLSWKKQRLFITHFEEAQRRATSTKRVRKHRSKLLESQGGETFHGGVTKHESETDPIRNDPKRSKPLHHLR